MFLTSVAIACDQPFVLSFEDVSKSSALVRWLDLNENPVHWDIEFGPKGFQPTGIPSVSMIEQQELEIGDLDSGSAYDIYLRTICEDSQSDWNGPFVFVTNIANPSRCLMGLDIRDNNCPNENMFNIEVATEGSSLGQDVFLDHVELIISHDWPPDLKISLKSPSGKEVLLSRHHGIGSDHYGNPSEINCTQAALFSDKACNAIEEVSPPFIGEFKPEQELAIFNDGSDPNGIWELLICDRAFGDLGELEFVEIEFSDRVCKIPDTTYLSRIEDNYISVFWTPVNQCDSINIIVENLSGERVAAKTFACSEGTGQIDNLEPDTEYQLFYESNCSNQLLQMSCPQYFSTVCSPITILENFDSFEICDPVCDNTCNLGAIWTNSQDDDFDWTVNTGSTSTAFTGPEGDISNFGKYVFLESSNPNCGEGSIAILESTCIEIISNGNGCDFAFNYHMFGNDVNRLDFEISINDGGIWQSLFSREGEVSEEWQTAILDLSTFNGRVARFRFIAHSTEGTRGDIAVDQIQFFGSQIVDDSIITFYRDEDGDGVGTEGEKILRCSPIPPTGYSSTFGDCDDLDENIFPFANEIPCNAIDENCNGNEDDANPLSISIMGVQQESCLGALDGSIEISVLGGTEPYILNWNNGMIGDSIVGLTKGVYYAEVIDAEGCTIITDFIEIDADQQILMSIQNVDNTSCQGLSDGSISIQVSGGVPPYSFNWNSGQNVKDIDGLSPGFYTCTITDANQCKLVTDPILIENNPKIQAGVLLKENVSCFGNSDGMIIIGAIGGVEPYHFSWNTGQEQNEINSLVPGFYTCTITDGQGCMNVLKDIEISSPQNLVANIEALIPIDCFEDQTGSIEINTSGGTPPYTYAWSNGSFSEDLFNLEKGIYALTISDHNACTFVLSDLVIESPEDLEIEVVEIKPTTCLLSTDGSIEVMVTGGTPDYQFFWNNNPLDTNFLHSLPVNNYQLTVIDQFGCKKTISDLIIESLNTELDVGINILSENLCFGDSTAELTASLVSGSPPFDYNWSAGEKHIRFELVDTIANLVAGAYLVTVTDAEGCVGISDELILPEPSSLGINILQVEDNICYGDSMGFISVDVFGGQGDIFIEWNTMDSTQAIAGLPSGVYALTVSDSNQCQYISQEIFINQPEKLSIQIQTSPEIGDQMNGMAELILSGASPPYQIQWDENTGLQTGPIAVDLSSGTYAVAIIDANQCRKDTTVFVDVVNSTVELSPKLEIRLFPNPTNGQLRIYLLDEQRTIESTVLFNLNGMKIDSRKGFESNQSNTFNIDYRQIPTGLYFIEISLDNGIQVIKKLVISQ